MPRHANKRKYFQPKEGQQKRFKREELSPGMTGFLISCSKGNETRCVLESYDLLNEYMDVEMAKLDQQPNASASTEITADLADTKTETEEPEDMEKAMEDELKSFRSNAGIEERKARFKAVESGCNNIVFISSAVSDPSAFAHSILKDIHAGKKGKARYIQRLLPVVASCRVDIESVKKCGRTALEKYFSSTNNPTFLILYKTRNSAASLTRDDIIAAFGAIIKEINPACRANLDDPDYAISVDVVKTVCCISVVKDYAKLKKYNVHVEEDGGNSHSRVGMPTRKPDAEEKNGDEAAHKSVKPASTDVIPTAPTTESAVESAVADPKVDPVVV